MRTSSFSKVAGTAVSISVTPAAGTLAWTLAETLRDVLDEWREIVRREP